MEDRAEFAGNLKAELLDVRECLRRRELTQAEAMQRVTAVRERRLAGLREPQQQRFFDRASRGEHPKLEFLPQPQPYRIPIIRAADTGREI